MNYNKIRNIDYEIIRNMKLVL